MKHPRTRQVLTVNKKAASPVTVTQDTAATLSAEQVYRSVLSNYPDVLSVEQVSAALSVSTKTAYKLLNDGHLKSLKVGRAFKIPKVFVLEYLRVLCSV